MVEIMVWIVNIVCILEGICVYLVITKFIELDDYVNENKLRLYGSGVP
jgi:hypothetical protein